MQEELLQLGYSVDEMKDMYRSMLLVAYAPYCPLGVAQAQMISFSSAKDSDVEHYNHFNRKLWRMGQENKLKMSYFPLKPGNLLVAPDLGIDIDQHNFIGFEKRIMGLTDGGRALVDMMGTTLITGIKGSLDEQEDVPPVRELLSGGNERKAQIFDLCVENGKDVY